MSEEIWKPIRDFETFYEVSNLGRVRRLFAGGQDGWRTLKPWLNPVGTGYWQVTLHAGGRIRTNALVHHLVAEAFIGPRPPGMLVLHKNGKSRQCDADNLRYGTHKENMDDRIAHGTHNKGERHGMSKLTDEQAALIKARFVRGNRYYTGNAPDLAKEFGVSPTTIRRVARGEGWPHVTADGEILP